MVCTNLSAVLNTVDPCKAFHAERLHVRRILHNNRNDNRPLYVVVMDNGHMFIVSDYMPALTFEDNGARVFSVWSDSNYNWHVVEQ